MKKDRNTFFAESSFMNQSNFPGPVANMPYAQASYANNGFYAGPMNANPQFNYNTNIPNNSNYNNPNYNDYSDYESRLSKIERSINRIDARLSKLENANIYSDDDGTNNIFMV